MEYQKIAKDSKIHNKIIQRQLQIRMIKKYQKTRNVSLKERQKIIDSLGINITV